jgi:hypothetical protein
MSYDDENDENVQIFNAKEVVVKGVGSYLIPHKALLEDDTYLILKPSRYRSISKLITTRCTATVKTAIDEDNLFWTSKKKAGHRFLKKLRLLKSIAIRKKYDVKGPRLMSRQRTHRPKQMASDTIQVALPAVGDRPATTVSMFIPASQHANGKSPLYVHLDAMAIDHIAYMANEFFSTFDSDQEPEPDDIGEVIDDNSDHDEHVPGDVAVSTDEPSNIVPAPPAESSTDRPSFTSSPLFNAFLRGAQH